jgi:hypothetical protein
MDPSTLIAVRNHYVPQWFQRRFLTSGRGGDHLFYLDLHPESIAAPNQPGLTRKALRRLGPVSCFKQDHLYTTVFGAQMSDALERRFFGAIDVGGCAAVEFFHDYSLREGSHEAFEALLRYLCAQLLRTPKGLAYLRRLTGVASHQEVLRQLHSLSQLYATIWTDAVWEVMSCDGSDTKFIVTDCPVVTYNPGVYPGSREARGWMAPPERIGTQTIFPLGLDRCLVITNLQYVRNPKVSPLRVRENPRYFQPAMFDLRSIQTWRELQERDVIVINHILKQHAKRYIASGREADLYPEQLVVSAPWPKLVGPYTLMPDPRRLHFSKSTVVGYKDGSAFAINEFGHRDVDNARAERLRSVEWGTFQSHKRAWDERDRREGRPIPHIRDLLQM